jgi:hypothetical protein
MNNFKYIPDAHDGKKTVISGSFLARCIANRTIGGVSIGEDTTLFRFSLSDGGMVSIRMNGSQPEIHYSPPYNR